MGRLADQELKETEKKMLKTITDKYFEVTGFRLPEKEDEEDDDDDEDEDEDDPVQPPLGMMFGFANGAVPAGPPPPVAPLPPFAPPVDGEVIIFLLFDKMIVLSYS